VRIARDLAADLERLAALPRRAARPDASLAPHGRPRFARGIEAAFRQMWRHWCGRGNRRVPTTLITGTTPGLTATSRNGVMA